MTQRGIVTPFPAVRASTRAIIHRPEGAEILIIPVIPIDRTAAPSGDDDTAEVNERGRRT